MSQAADFFVSYTSADRAQAEWLAWQLEPRTTKSESSRETSPRLRPISRNAAGHRELPKQPNGRSDTYKA
jgi:hypothetical protein